MQTSPACQQSSRYLDVGTDVCRYLYPTGDHLSLGYGLQDVNCSAAVGVKGRKNTPAQSTLVEDVTEPTTCEACASI